MELHSMQLYSKKISANNAILFKGVLIPKLLNISLDSCFLINLVFLVSDIAHVDNNILLTLLVLETLAFMFFLFFTL